MIDKLNRRNSTIERTQYSAMRLPTVKEILTFLSVELSHLEQWITVIAHSMYTLVQFMNYPMRKQWNRPCLDDTENEKNFIYPEDRKLRCNQAQRIWQRCSFLLVYKIKSSFTSLLKA